MQLLPLLVQELHKWRYDIRMLEGGDQPQPKAWLDRLLRR